MTYGSWKQLHYLGYLHTYKHSCLSPAKVVRDHVLHLTHTEPHRIVSTPISFVLSLSDLRPKKPWSVATDVILKTNTADIMYRY